MEETKRVFQESDNKHHYDVTLRHMGYDLYIPYAEHIEFMDVLDSSIRALDSKKSEIQQFVNDLPKYVNSGEITQEFSMKLVEDRINDIEKLEKLINVAVKIIEQIESV